MNPSYNINEIKASLDRPILNECLYQPMVDFGALMKAIGELHDEINPVIDKIGILKRNIAKLSYDNRELKKIIIALDEELRMLKEKEGPCMCRPSEGVEWSSGEPYQDDEVTETIK